MICNESEIQEKEYKVKKTPKQKLYKLHQRMAKNAKDAGGLAFGFMIVFAAFIVLKIVGYLDAYPFMFGLISGFAGTMFIVMLSTAENKEHVKLKKIIDKLP